MNLFEEARGTELPKLALELFVVFSRFEFALKRSRTYAAISNGRVIPDWDGFAKDLGSKFWDEIFAKEVASALISNPPKKQVLLANGELGWKDVSAVKNTAELFLAIRQARNNLFHGAKYQHGSSSGRVDFVEGSERNDALLAESLAVLTLALTVRPDIHDLFRSHG